MDPATAAGPAPPVAPTVWAAAVRCACGAAVLWSVEGTFFVRSTHPPLSSPQADARVPDDAWEFHARKSANDAAYQGLDYAPYVSTMPVVAPATAGGGDSGGVTPKWAWKKKGGGSGGGH